jgi:hypothetical protein
MDSIRQHLRYTMRAQDLKEQQWYDDDSSTIEGQMSKQPRKNESNMRLGEA